MQVGQVLDLDLVGARIELRDVAARASSSEIVNPGPTRPRPTSCSWLDRAEPPGCEEERRGDENDDGDQGDASSARFYARVRGSVWS